jgi:hypothetical protein
VALCTCASIFFLPSVANPTVTCHRARDRWFCGRGTASQAIAGCASGLVMARRGLWTRCGARVHSRAWHGCRRRHTAPEACRIASALPRRGSCVGSKRKRPPWTHEKGKCTALRLVRIRARGCCPLAPRSPLRVPRRAGVPLLPSARAWSISVALPCKCRDHPPPTRSPRCGVCSRHSLCCTVCCVSLPRSEVGHSRDGKSSLRLDPFHRSCAAPAVATSSKDLHRED